MMMQGQRPQELALPVASLAALRRALEDAIGPDHAALALQAAGNAAGDAFHAILGTASGDTSPDEWSEAIFWRRFFDLFARRGWGRLSNERVHEGVAALTASDWVEADPESGAERPSCSFTAGLLANLLGRISSDEVAVLEVECRSRGDQRCRFLYGSAPALDAVYARLRAGEAVGDTLATLR
jgi:predicted hydrocarbon binding protein